MVKYNAGHVIAVGRSDHPEWSAKQVLKWHIDDGYWYSSAEHPGLFDRETVYIRYVPGSRVIGRAIVEDSKPAWLEPADRPEPDLQYRWAVTFLNATPLEGVWMSDFGIAGARLRPGLVGLRHQEVVAIEEALPQG